MPSKTPKQKSFMAAVAANPKFAKKVGVAPKVGKEFAMKDKKMGMKKMASGGGINKQMPTADEMGNMNLAKGGKATKFGAALKKKSADTKGRAMMKSAKGGSIDGCAARGKTDTKMSKMAKGGKSC